MPRMVVGGLPCPGKILVQRGRPTAKTAEMYTFSLITGEPYKIAKQVLRQIEVDHGLSNKPSAKVVRHP